MKNMKRFCIAALLLFGIGGASAQSLGDYARAARKNKPEPSAASHHYDNDNLPASEHLSVVGPPAGADGSGGQAANSAPAQAADAAAANADRQKAAADWQKKLDEQKGKIDALSHELDLDQREYRLRAAAMYGDAGNRLRNSAEWDKEDSQYKTDIDAKQKAIDDARAQLDQMQEEARKAGVTQKEKDADKDNDAGKDTDKDKDKDNK